MFFIPTAVSTENLILGSTLIALIICVCKKLIVPLLDYFVKASIAVLISKYCSNDFSYLKEWEKFIGARDVLMTYDQAKFPKTTDSNDKKFQNSKTHTLKLHVKFHEILL